MNVNTIKNAIIGSISKYKGQQITETLLVSETREDLVEVNVPDSVCRGNNPLIGTDY